MASPDLTVLRRLAGVYDGPGSGLTRLRALGAELSVPLGSPREALVLVVGDAGCGKSAFVNALVQELVLPVGAQERCAQWVHSSEGTPRLLHEAREKFPTWSCAQRCGSALHGVEVAELHIEGSEEEALAWIGQQADVVVCLMNWQEETLLSDAVWRWLKALPSTEAEDAAPELQFVFAKAETIPRESERVRLTSKASRLTVERLGRGFQVLPVAAGDLSLLLDAVTVAPSFTVGGKEFAMGDRDTATARRFDLGLSRTLQAAQGYASQRLAKGLETMRHDCQVLSAALEKEMESTARRVESATSLRVLLFQVGGAFLIAGVVLPYILEAEEWLVHIMMQVLIGMAVLFLILASLLPKQQEAPDGQLRQHSSLKSLNEKVYFVRLLERQRAVWAGEPKEVVEKHPAEPGDESSNGNSPGLRQRPH